MASNGSALEEQCKDISRQSMTTNQCIIPQPPSEESESEEDDEEEDEEEYDEEEDEEDNEVNDEEDDDDEEEDEEEDDEEDEEEDDDEDDEEEKEEGHEEDQEEDEDSNWLINSLSLGLCMGYDDDTLDMSDIWDTYILHNDRYPEASAVDLLDNMDGLTLDAGNLPDLTKDQTPSMDESTRRDEQWSEGIMHIENMSYLNHIIKYVQDEVGPRFAVRDWVFYFQTNGNCEHMHLALKFWNYFVLPYPDMREVVGSGQVICYCSDCQPDATPPFAGWVRIERSRATMGSHEEHVFWHVLRSTVMSASSLSGEPGTARRPCMLGAQPCTDPSSADVWFDEEGKPHHTVLALDIGTTPDTDASLDRLRAYMIYVRSHIDVNEDNADPQAFED